MLSSGSVNGGTGVFWGFYAGGDFTPAPTPGGLPGADGPPGAPLEGLLMRPGLAMSQDGRNWARIEGEHHSGALLDVGAPGEFDAAFIAGPQVVAAGPRDMRMYYHSYDAARAAFVVGVATSADGFKWAKRGEVFAGGAGGGDPAAHDALGAAARHVVRDPATRRYLMFYEAVGPGGARSLGLASSEDGLTGWRRLGRPLLAPSAPGGWDAGGVGAPCAVPMSAGRWRVYYAGRRGGGGPWEGYGLALSVEGGELFEGAPADYRRRTGRAEGAVI
jgi:hypothetical protein